MVDIATIYGGGGARPERVPPRAPAPAMAPPRGALAHPPQAGEIVAVIEELKRALLEKKRVVQLPPHIFPPWRARPWAREGRLILPGASGAAAAVGTSASQLSIAEDDVTVAEDAVNEVVGNATFTVPQGYIGVLRQWAGEPADLLGYDASHVSFSLDVGGEIADFPTSPLGLYGTFDNPWDVSYALLPRATVRVLASNASTAMCHLVYAFLSGYLVEANEIDESIAALIAQPPEE